MGGETRRHHRSPTSSARGSTPFMFNDPGDNIGPKSCDLWKPVIAAVNGMACGGAFYMLGEVEFIIAAEHATFFDPHVTYGMTAAFEPIHMAGHHAVPRDHAALAAGQLRAHVGAAGVPDRHGVRGRARRRARATAPRELAAIIASQPTLAIEGTVRAHLGDARDAGSARRCGSATRTSRWARTRSRSPRARRSSRPASASSGSCGDGGHEDESRSSVRRCPTAGGSTRRRRSSCTTRPRRAPSPTPASPRTTSTASARAAWACSRRSRSPSTSGCGRRGSTAPASAASTWEFMVEHAAAAIQAGHAEVVVLVYGSTTRADLKARRRTRQPRVRRAAARSSSTCRSATRSSRSTRWRRAGTCTSSARRSSSSPRSRCRRATTRRSTPRPTTATRSRSTTCRASRMIADPLTKLHCCIRSDGGGAVVLTTEERARDLPSSRSGCSARARRRQPHDDERVGGLHRVPRGPLAASSRSSGPASRRTTSTSARSTTRSRSMVLLSLEALGFCEQGRGRPVRRGRQAARRRRAADQHRRRRPLALPPRHARHVPAGRGGAAAPRRGGRPPGRGRASSRASTAPAAGSRSAEHR